jgi:hypothetical protein
VVRLAPHYEDCPGYREDGHNDRRLPAAHG